VMYGIDGVIPWKNAGSENGASSEYVIKEISGGSKVILTVDVECWTWSQNSW